MSITHCVLLLILPLLQTADTSKAQALAKRREKDELLGKIEAHYQRIGKEAPFGLAASPVEKLREHLKRLQQK